MKSAKFDREKIEGGLLEKLLALHRGEPDKVPKGHKTSEEWAKEWGIKRQMALALIRKGMAKGLMGKEFHKVRVGKVTRPTEHYFEI